MITALTLATQKPFGSLTCDFYKNDSGEFYMTREQVGQALEYKDPAKSIAKIHERNPDRLNPLSGGRQFDDPRGTTEHLCLQFARYNGNLPSQPSAQSRQIHGLCLGCDGVSVRRTQCPCHA